MPDTPVRITIDGCSLWLFPDGTTLPVVSGGDGDDDFGAEDLGGASAAFSAALDDDFDLGGADDDGGDPEPTGDPAGDGGEARMVPWDDYVSLRRENASYRQRFQKYEQTFSGLDPEVADALLGVAQLYGEDPDSAAQALLEAFGVGQGPPAAGQEPDAIRAAVRAEMEAFFSQQQQQVQQQQAVQQSRESIQNVAKSLGVEPGTKEYRRLLTLARDEFSTDEFGEPVAPDQAIRSAHQAMTTELAEFEERIKASLLESKANQGGVRVTGAGDTASGEKPIESLADSRAALRAWAETA